MSSLAMRSMLSSLSADRPAKRIVRFFFVFCDRGACDLIQSLVAYGQQLLDALGEALSARLHSFDGLVAVDELHE